MREQHHESPNNWCLNAVHTDTSGVDNAGTMAPAPTWGITLTLAEALRLLPRERSLSQETPTQSGIQRVNMISAVPPDDDIPPLPLQADVSNKKGACLSEAALSSSMEKDNFP